jgi:hypothetical protein
VAGALLAVPVLVDLALSGTRGLFRYFAADTFYYFQVAETWAATGVPSFDGENPTNGFHPLWQAVLAGAAAVGLTGTALMWTAVLLSLGLLLIAVVLLGAAIERAGGGPSPWLVLLPLGVYAVTLIPLWLWFGGERENRVDGDMPLYGTLWSFANGMETPAAIAAFAGLVFVAVAWGFHDRRAVAGLTLAASLLVLARLDTALVVGGWIAVLLAAAVIRRDKAMARGALLVAGGVGAVVVAYMLVNLAYSDRAMPISGTTKTSFPDPSLDNLRELRSLLAGEGDRPRARLYRLWPMVLPALVAAAWLAIRLRGAPRGPLSPRDRYRLALMGTAVGVLALSAYDLLFVSLFNQGWWYMPVSIVFVTLAALEALDRFRSPWVLAAGALAAVAVFLALGRPADYNRRFADFYLDVAPRVRADYAAREPLLFAWDDGIDAFALGFPAISGTGLMLDAEAWDAWYSGRLLDVALRRGYDRFSSVAYLDATGLTPATPAPEIRRRLEPLLPGEPLEAYDFEVEYRSRPFTPPVPGATGEYVLIRISRLTSASR